MIKKLALITLVALSLTGCNDKLFSSANAIERAAEDPTARPAKIVTAHQVALKLPKSFPGVTKASNNAELSFRIAGQVDTLPVRAGQILKKGDLIAELDDTPYRNVLAAKEASYDLAKVSLERTEQLFEKNHVAQAALDSAKSTFESAQADLKAAQDNIGYTRITAPFSGIVAKTYVERYQTVSAGTSIAKFQSNEGVDVEFNVPEKLFLRFNPKKLALLPKIEVRFDALPDRAFEATYKEINTVPDSVTRSYKVTITMPSPEEITVFPGMSVSASVDIAKILNFDDAEGVLVPLEAVFDENGSRWVWKVDESNQARKTEVEVYGIQDGMIRISHGIAEGDRVIAIGTAHVTEGMKVRTYKKEGGL
ncbi:efflux RND transporter periplasmic adaptor subunit [uncultured Cohaesibacter sp.]|uniref:efflux RND transporter periplasmic adaptor subunit n=1 Tax=uncultured Cohaesibacter sp. TaxID=1002546 RepID=UPI00292F19FA|nr:efflux RND transporter periplasmic adaptor subunit [uncultured Cohaesibacter sp.]